jgi:DNA polymerase
MQTLENYQRCGLRRFAKRSAEELPADVLDQISALLEFSEAAEPPVPVSRVPPPHFRSAPTAPIKSAPPASDHSSGPVEVGSWSLPVLSEGDRRKAFDQLNTEVVACRKCTEIVNFRQQTVFGVGTLRPRLCFVGEAPGADEDKQGEPFVGRAGQLLTKIINAMTLKREEVYILNALKCRPPQNRTPMPMEIDNCRPFVERQLEVLRPEYLVCLGAVAVRCILNLSDPIGSLRGKWHTYRGAKVIVTYHPSYLLRNESAKRLVWDDMKLLMREMGLNQP